MIKFLNEYERQGIFRLMIKVKHETQNNGRNNLWLQILNSFPLFA